MLEVSRPLRPFLTAAARGQTEVFPSGATRIFWVSMWSAAPMDENTGMPVSVALLSRDILHLTVSIASTRMSKSPSRISPTVPSSTRRRTPSMSMSGLMERALSHATSAFGLPTVSTVASIWRLRLLPLNTSPSTTRILPIPARTSPSRAYPPTAPAPQRITDAPASFSTPSSPTSSPVLCDMSDICYPPRVVQRRRDHMLGVGAGADAELLREFVHSAEPPRRVGGVRLQEQGTLGDGGHESFQPRV